MKRRNSFLWVVFLIFVSLCSSPDDKGVASVSNDTTTTLVIAEEDYPVVLTQCLNEEMGYNLSLIHI